MNSIFSTIFELIYNSQMNSDLYDFNLYGTCGLVMISLSVSICLIFYFLFDKAKFAGILAWLIALMITILLIMALTIYFSRDTLIREGIEYPFSEYFYFSSVVAIYGAILFFLLSIIIKRFRINLIHSPF
jgi:hypothetical protein